MLVVPLPTGYLLTNSAHLKTQQAKERYFVVESLFQELALSTSQLYVQLIPVTEVCLSRLSSEEDARECCTQRS